jgi:hypothetical protein
MSLRRNWPKFWALPPAQQGRLAATLVSLSLVALGLRWLGLRRVQALLAWLAPLPAARLEPPSPAAHLDQARRLATLVKQAAAGAPRPLTCLPQALTLWWLLRRRGLLTDLRLGVRKTGGSFEAHAWVEYEGVVLNDQPDVQQRFAPFTQIGVSQEVSLQ